MASSRSSLDESFGGAVKVSGGSKSVSALFSSSEVGTSLGGGSSSTSSHVHNNNGSPTEEPVDLAVEQTNAPEESGDVINIDVADEGEEANLPIRTKIFGDEVEDGFLRVKVCAGNERVCHGKGGAKVDFFYVYACFFHDLGLIVPFADWQMVVLREIRCAPTQIHPNAWASMQAFDVLCRVVSLTATMPLFLHFYKTRPTASKGWVSFLGVNKSLFSIYLASYKDAPASRSLSGGPVDPCRAGQSCRSQNSSRQDPTEVADQMSPLPKLTWGDLWAEDSADEAAARLSVQGGSTPLSYLGACGILSWCGRSFDGIDSTCCH
ncbi:hypothetical protein DEO72_LG5g722 [Vigna unguiculata]|uniref:Transposase (putative) gypsy type domain-containing protein n=1 Tax=Vigna unguiculata TaxID=3917 RepID=A0A4D6LXP4_VIGUN|nr:hypothetical protein DEO72_LG5g722 [Vigna unguiculata]